MLDRDGEDDFYQGGVGRKRFAVCIHDIFDQRSGFYSEIVFKRIEITNKSHAFQLGKEVRNSQFKQFHAGELPY